MPGSYELKHSDSKFMWHLRAVNGETILTSVRYESKEAARNGIESCRVSAILDFCYERGTSSAGQPYFVVRGSNRELIGTSKMYSSNAARERGIDICKANGPTASVVDAT